MEFLGREYPDPNIGLSCNGERVEVNNENTSLHRYRDIGRAGIRLSMYDHVFYHNQEDNTVIYGFLTDLTKDDKDYLTMAMIANNYLVVQNLNDVSEFDANAYEENIIQPQLDELNSEEIPESWFDEK